MPYTYSCFYEATQTGMPVARSLAIDYSSDANIYTSPFDNQFLFGPSILVVPVDSTSLFHEAYIPEGVWYNAYTDEIQQGATVSVVKADKEILPLYIKAGSIILMQSVIQSLQAHKSSNILEVHVYPGADGVFNSYEDDGETYAFQRGQSLQRKFTLSGKSLTIESVVKEYVSHRDTFRIYLHGIQAGTNIHVNGNSMESKSTSYRFIEPVSDFDPYHVPPKDPIQIQNLVFVDVKIDGSNYQINW
jgi:alpha-glucosidase